MSQLKSKVRALSLAQAQACENAVHPHCDCRCGGAAHGKGRAKLGGVTIPEKEIPRAFFEELPPDDPHRLPNAAELRAHRKRMQQRRKLVKAVESWRASLARYDSEWSREGLEHAEKQLARFDAAAPIGEGAPAVREWMEAE